MPTLPPRNLPFSTPPRTPQAKSNAGSPANANTPTPSKLRGSEGSGILARQDETTYHRKLRAILWDVQSECEKWEDVVSSEGAKALASISGLASDLDRILKRPLEERGEERAGGLLRLDRPEREARRLDEMADTLRGLGAEKEIMSAAMARITKTVRKLESLAEAAETLLIDATRARGADFTFEREMWVTWCMGRFVSLVQLIVSRHALQSAHLQTLYGLLLEQGCAPGQSSSLTDRPHGGERDGEDEEVESEDDEGREAQMGRARVRERVMEDWKSLPLLPDERTGINVDYFEDVCEAEVGRWNED